MIAKPKSEWLKVMAQHDDTSAIPNSRWRNSSEVYLQYNTTITCSWSLAQVGPGTVAATSGAPMPLKCVVHRSGRPFKS